MAMTATTLCPTAPPGCIMSTKLIAMRKLPLIAGFILLVTTVANCIASYGRARVCLDEDLNRALMLTIRDKGLERMRQDSIRAYRSDELLARRATVIPAEAEPAVKPQGSSRQSKSKARGSRSARTRNRTVTIRQGDTLEAIAKRNGTTVAKLRRLNGIKGSNIRAGKKIKIQ